jgi:hypothetical protein
LEAATVTSEETANQMIEALKSAQRYLTTIPSAPPDLIAQIDAAIRRGDAEQRGHLTAED